MSGLLSLLDRFNADHPWSHNDAYAPVVLRHARQVRRAGGTTALDVGCGTGNLLLRLAGIMSEVTGLEPDAATAARARDTVAGHRNADVREEAFDLADHDQRRYDLVTFVAVLHHLPLTAALRAARSSVRPGGRLVVIGLARETAADLPWTVLSVVLTALVGLILHPRGVSGPPESMAAPTAEPLLTFEQIKAVACDVLPGVRMRRSLFWRHLLVWTAPDDR
ncbi:bifunctional 2-polyprenyl-6-hydroxyphenol methylase/3-demethylubiquinol 3-O-methyltransferase UbiG [Curtobacterium sp. 9128]|uniref:class I SAM-dependent methyltransferase n=1 Tax=Curtobacterium sp. 9128 TaxID=1793722 RepID=UPI00119E2280|nr:class I SAM-dependent methyltransferase [Curtobacterium sp. 9128]